MSFTNCVRRTTKTILSRDEAVGEPLRTVQPYEKSKARGSCGIYRDNAFGVEVRTGYSDDDLLLSQRTADIGSAREIA